VLTLEPTLIEQYVAIGQLQLAFRPVLNHGERSLFSSEAAFCASEQNAFWPMHELLFARQDELWATDPANYPALMTAYADELALDRAAFDACMAADQALALVQALDAEQRERGIRVQPVFEIAGQRLVGLQSLETFQRLIAAAP
jgi:protein-disulfide isomerase